MAENKMNCPGKSTLSELWTWSDLASSCERQLVYLNTYASIGMQEVCEVSSDNDLS